MPSDKQLLQYYINNINFKNYVDEREHWNENLFTFWECFELYEKKIKKLKPKKEREIKFCWITLQNFNQRMEDIDKFILFTKKIEYLYHEGYWILEKGKSDPPNLHLHLLVKIINPKKHKQQLGIAWNNIFNNNILEKDFYKLCQHRDCKGMPSYENWCQEKLDYMNNDLKGDHANSDDLGIKGQWGAVDSV